MDYLSGMPPNSFTIRYFYQTEFVICRVIQFEGKNHYFAATMTLKDSHFAQRYIESGNEWIPKYDEAFFNGSNTQMIPVEISTKLLKHLQEHYPINVS